MPNNKTEEKNENPKARGGYPFPSCWLPQFKHEIEAKLLKNYPEVPHSLRYHFAFVHVYNDGKTRMIDNDNRDVKQTIDTIANILCFSDWALSVSYSSCPIVNDRIKNGSYICISPDYGNPVELEKIVVLLEQNFYAGK